MLWPTIIALLAVAFVALILWGKNKGLSFKWYEWLMVVIGLVLLVFTLENFVGSFEEATPQAAWMFLLVTGLPSLILLIIPLQLTLRRNRAV